MQVGGALRVAAAGWIRRGSETGGPNVGEPERLARRKLMGWRRDKDRIWWEIAWHETSLLDQSVPKASADVQNCTRIRRGFVPGHVPV